MPASVLSAVVSPGSVRPSAGHHGPRGQQLGLRGDLGQHPAEEGVDDLHTGDVDEDTMHPGAGDGLREILLELLGRAVVQVSLERDQQDVTEPENRHVTRGGMGVRVAHR
jgi:hypothetical protein